MSYSREVSVVLGGSGKMGVVLGGGECRTRGR